MFELIIAIDKEGGIGNKGSLPWHCPEELQLFKQKTQDNILVMGRNTIEKLPTLKDRSIYGLTSDKDIPFLIKEGVENEIIPINSEKEIINVDNKKIFISGGKKIYEYFLKNKKISKIHLSMMKKKYICDTSIDLAFFKNFTITEMKNYVEFKHFVLENFETGETNYLKLIENVYNSGEEIYGRNGRVIKKFGENISFDLRMGFPLLTTKRMFFRGIVEEFLFFMRGDTDSTILEEKGINIWKGNTSRQFLDSIGMSERKTGVMGPMYGYNWRYFGAEYDEQNACPKDKKEGVDQLKNVIDMIKTDPFSRRIIITSYNPSQLSECVLPPCHSVVLQFSVDSHENFLDMIACQRSSDLFLGLPFNIASYSLMLYVIAKLTCKIPRKLHINIGDAHIYEEHIEAVKEQIMRIPFGLPSLDICNLSSFEDIEKLKYEDFKLKNYQSHKTIKVSMVS